VAFVGHHLERSQEEHARCRDRAIDDAQRAGELGLEAVDRAFDHRGNEAIATPEVMEDRLVRDVELLREASERDRVHAFGSQMCESGIHDARARFFARQSAASWRIGGVRSTACNGFTSWRHRRA
jgi:hypothetical protein